MTTPTNTTNSATPATAATRHVDTDVILADARNKAARCLNAQPGDIGIADWVHLACQALQRYADLDAYLVNGANTPTRWNR